MKKRLILLFLALVLTVAAFAVPAFADPEPESYEIVILLDVSGSMVSADSSRLSIQAAKAFAYYRPSTATKFEISLVLYNTEIYRALEKINVATEDGMNRYQTVLDEIGKVPYKGNYNGFQCWFRDTDIGLALKDAEQILLGSTATHKAALLFTDGRIDLPADPGREEPSRNDSYAVADAFAAKDIPLFTVGLNRNGSVDKTFLEEIAKPTADECFILDDNEKLVSLFQKLFAHFVGGTSGSTQIPTKPDELTGHDVNIFGEAISEANLVLFSTAKINSYAVINPNGVKVAEWKEGGNETIASGVTVNRAEMLVAVKLTKPTDGMWRVEFTSKEAGYVQVGEIYLYNLIVKSDAPAQTVVGDSVDFNAVLHNADTNQRVNTKQIYEESNCTVTIRSPKGNDIRQGVLNSASNGYSTSYTFDQPGVYEIIYKIDNDQFSVETESKIEVLAPSLSLSGDKGNLKAGDEIKITATLKHPITGAQMALPAYLTGFRLNAEIKCDGTVVYATDVDYASDTDISFTYRPVQSGKYSVSVTMSRYDDKVTSTSPLTFTAWAPAVRIEPAGTTIGRGETLDFAVTLVNPSDNTVIPASEYPTGYAVKAILLKDDAEVETITVVPGANGTLSGSVSISAVGNYTLKAEMTAPGGVVYVSDKITSVTVGDPTLTILPGASDPSMDQGAIALGLKLYSASGTALTEAPSYMTDCDVRFAVNGTEVYTAKLGAFLASGATYSYTPDKAGDYNVVVTVDGNGQTLKAELKMTVKASVISFADGQDLADIAESTLSGEVVKEIDLSTLFTDTDKDTLIFSAVSDNEAIKAEISGQTLILTIPSGAAGNVTLTVSDGKGASFDTSFSVEIKSLMPLVIGIIVAIVVVIAGVVIFMIIVKKRSVIRVTYRIKLEYATDISSYSQVFSIGRASNNSRATPTMTVQQILNLAGLAQKLHGDMDSDLCDRVIYDFCSKVSLTGMPFKQGFKISQAGKSDLIYAGHRVSVRLTKEGDDGTETVTIYFGSTTDFREEY